MILSNENKKYTVLLIEPGEDFSEKGCGVLAKQTPSLGLVSIATYLKRSFPQIFVKIIDQQNQNSSLNARVESYLHSFLKEESPELVGIQSYSYNFLSACKTAKEVRSILPKAFIVLGGPHPSVVPKEVLDYCIEIDGAVVGEGEKVLEELVETKDDPDSHEKYGFKRSIDGLYTRHSSFVSRQPIEDLDSIPYPDWSVVQYKQRYARAYSYKYRMMEFLFPISTSRGCCFNCQFCLSSYLSKNIRMRSPKSVIEEIIYNWETYNARFFYFTDPNFLYDINRAENICDLIREEIYYKRNGRLSFRIQTRANFDNEKILYKLRATGCELIFLGIESGDDKVLKYNKPGQTVKMVEKVVANIRRVGIRVKASFLLGLPFETEESIQKTVSFIQSLDLDDAAFHTLDVYPGTILSEKVKTENYGGLYLDNSNEVCLPTVNQEKNEVCLPVVNIEKNEFQYSRNTPLYGVNDLTAKDLGETREKLSEMYPQLRRSRVREDILRKNLCELRYFLDWDSKVFDRILDEKIEKIKKVQDYQRDFWLKS